MEEPGLYNYTWKIVMTETTQSTKYEKNFRIQDIRISPFVVKGNKTKKITVSLSIVFIVSQIELPYICLF